MHVDAGNPLMDRFHNRPPSAKLSGARGFEGLGRIPRKLRLRDNLGYGLSSWVRLIVGV